jgi:hypothetical protein
VKVLSAKDIGLLEPERELTDAASNRKSSYFSWFNQARSAWGLLCNIVEVWVGILGGICWVFGHWEYGYCKGC